VGRDIPRKLSPEDRLIGALRISLKHGLEAPFTCLGIGAAMLFRATDEKGELFEKDREFAEKVYPRGVDHVLGHICQLRPDTGAERKAIEIIKKHHEGLQGGASEWLAGLLL